MAYEALSGNGVGGVFDGTEPRVGKQTLNKVRNSLASHETRVVALEGAGVNLGGTVTGNLPLANLPTNFAQTFRRSVTFTDANVKALPTTPLTLVAAPGAGLTIVPNKVLLFAKFAAGAYTNVDAAAELVVKIGADDWSSYIPNDAGASPALTYATAFAAGANKRWVLREWTDATDPTVGWGSLATPGTYLSNAALTLNWDNGASGNLTGGNAGNSLVAIIEYSLEVVP